MGPIATLCLLSFSAIGTLLAAPTSYHNQQQHGDYNLHARLDNFIVVLIPKTNFFDSTWLDYVKRINLQDHLKHVKKEKPKPQESVILDEVDDDDDELEEDRWSAPPEILPKNPYTVDVEIKSHPSSSPLSRLHPVPVLDISSDVMVALSPPVALSKSSGAVAKPLKTLAVQAESVKTTSKPTPTSEKPSDTTEQPEVPQDEPKVSTRIPAAPEEATEAVLQPLEAKPLEEPARGTKKSKSIISTTLERVQKTSKSMDADKQAEREKEMRLRLIGSGIDVCEPNERRTEDGSCVPIKPRQRSGQYFASSGLLPALRFGLSPANE